MRDVGGVAAGWVVRAVRGLVNGTVGGDLDTVGCGPAGQCGGGYGAGGANGGDVVGAAGGGVERVRGLVGGAVRSDPEAAVVAEIAVGARVSVVVVPDVMFVTWVV